ncbi:tryptophan-rich sensory protein [Ohtaekwangia kribbensis]|uniref:Tryptophan-rich sensory protein n=1 Tax=Ohtaekwangia kribbensis TaxID=688913 RepID=A0ABW3K7Y7_9BACT
MNTTLLRIAATLSFAGTITVNALANILPINGLNTGQVSDLYPSLFTPAGLTFSIWSVIYFLLAGFVVMSWLRSDDKMINRVLPWFIFTCVLNMGWILAWHHLLATLSVFIMLALLSILTYIFRMLHQSDSADMKLKLWVILPFTVYLAWICVATIANIAAWLIALGWQGGSIPPQLWTILMMTIAAALALKVTIDYRVPFFSLVVIWALFGIYFRWHNSSYSSITIAAMVLMTFLAVGIFYVMRKRTTA